MKPGLFEEHLNKAAEEFALQAREGMWQHIETALEPEKDRKAFPLLWALAGGLLYIGAILMNPVHKASSQQVQIAVAESKREIDAIHHVENAGTKDQQNSGNDKVLGSMNDLRFSDPLVSNYHLHHAGREIMVQHEDDIHTSLPVLTDEEHLNAPNKDAAKTVLSPETTFVQSHSSDEELPPTDSVVAQTAKTQDTTKPGIRIDINIPVRGSFYAGLVFAPGWSSARVHLNQPGARSTSDYFNRKATDRSASAYTFGLTGGYTTGRHRFETGLQYSTAGYYIKVKNVEPPVVSTFTSANILRMNANDSFRLTGSAEDGSYFHTVYHFINIPVGYSYRIWGSRKWHVSLNARFSYNRIVASNALMYDQEKGYYVLKQMDDNKDLQKNNFTLSGGAEFSYRLMKSLELGLRPQFGHTLNPVEKGAFSTGLQFKSLTFGVRWIFN